MCSHHQTCAGKYLFQQTQQGLEFVQRSARNQNDGARMLAQRLPEQDNQPKIFDGPERARNISNLCRCHVVMSTAVAIHCTRDASRDIKPRRPSRFSVRLERRFSVPACNLTERRSPRRSREARSRIFAESMASTGEHWTLRAVATSATLRQAGASELPLPLPAIPTARREAEAGSHQKA